MKSHTAKTSDNIAVFSKMLSEQKAAIEALSKCNNPELLSQRLFNLAAAVRQHNQSPNAAHTAATLLASKLTDFCHEHGSSPEFSSSLMEIVTSLQESLAGMSKQDFQAGSLKLTGCDDCQDNGNGVLAYKKELTIKFGDRELKQKAEIHQNEYEECRIHSGSNLLINDSELTDLLGHNEGESASTSRLVEELQRIFLEFMSNNHNNINSYSLGLGISPKLMSDIINELG